MMGWAPTMVRKGVKSEERSDLVTILIVPTLSTFHLLSPQSLWKSYTYDNDSYRRVVLQVDNDLVFR